MATYSKSSARTAIDVAEAGEIARRARTGDPNALSREGMEALLGSSALVLDGMRRRPHYFDGRFLTGADLTRDQDYIRQRQADFTRAGGTGVVQGLEVELAGRGGAGNMLVIQPGHGVTPSGEVVLVANRREVSLGDLPAVQRLDATMGLRLEPRAPLGRRSGLFVLALRPVEFTANPIAAYPTSIAGPRQVEDGDIIEATAITLIPYADGGGAGSLEEARRAVARRLFVEDAGRGLPQDALPIAMLALERGVVRWIDVAMVRRETGADTPLQVSMGARPRALAEAFVLQHRRHLADVLRDRAAAGLPPAFAAAQYFAALPAAGQLPAAAILRNPMGFSQLWFPPSVDVELSFAPSDEIAALVEESLALPPIDLMDEPETLDATAVVVIAPVTRQRLQRFEGALHRLSVRALADSAQGIRRPAADMLAAMLARRAKLAEAAQRDADADEREQAADAETRAWDAAWSEAIAALPTHDELPPLLWYVRRRAVATQGRVIGIAVSISGDDERLTNAVDARLGEAGLADRVRAVREVATPFAVARMQAFLGAPRILGSDLFLTAAVRDLEATRPAKTPGGGERPAEEPSGGGVNGDRPTRPTRPGRPTLPSRLDVPNLRDRLQPGGAIAIRPGLDRIASARAALARVRVRQPAERDLLSEADVLDVASDYGGPKLGDGIARIEAVKPLDAEQQRWLGDSGRALELDARARDLDAGALPGFAERLAELAAAKDGDALARLTAGEA